MTKYQAVLFQCDFYHRVIDDNEKPLKEFDDKDEAIKFASNYAKENNGSFIVQINGSDGFKQAFASVGKPIGLKKCNR